MIVLGLDPGSCESALVEWDTIRKRPLYRAKLGNAAVFAALADRADAHVLVVESTTAYTLPGGAASRFMPQQILETAEWVGQFCRCWQHELGGSLERLDRRKVKLHLLGRASGTDAHVRAALLDLIGPQGTKAAPGPTYGMRADLWAALAVAFVWHEKHQQARAVSAPAANDVGRASPVGSGDDRPF